VQSKDISTIDILKFLKSHQGRWCTWGVGYSMPTVADAMPKGTPEKLQRAKMSILIRHKLVDGCDCGCRGDYEITQQGIDYLERHLTQRPPGAGESAPLQALSTPEHSATSQNLSTPTQGGLRKPLEG